MVKRHPSTLFHFFIITAHQIKLYDERYPMRPLLSWLHHVENGPRQVVVPNVKFPQNPTASTCLDTIMLTCSNTLHTDCIFLDGGEKGGVIVWMYEYDMSGFVEHNDEMDALCELITQGRFAHQLWHLVKGLLY